MLVAPEHIICPGVGNVTTGAGFTVMVKVCCCPLQLFAVGITVIVAVTGTLVVFTALNDVMSPEPEPARPMDVLLLIQLNCVLAIVPLKATAVVALPLQTVCEAIAPELGVGFTMTSIVKLLPAQLPAVGVTIY